MTTVIRALLAGFASAAFVGLLLWLSSDPGPSTLPVAPWPTVTAVPAPTVAVSTPTPTVTPEPAPTVAPAPTPTPVPLPPAFWLHVDPGVDRQPIILIAESKYPVAGVEFYLNGVFNRVDLTGPFDPPNFWAFHMHDLDLVVGDVLSARWVDGTGTELVDEYVVVDY